MRQTDKMVENGNTPEVQAALEETIKEFQEMTSEEFRRCLSMVQYDTDAETLGVHSMAFLRQT